MYLRIDPVRWKVKFACSRLHCSANNFVIVEDGIDIGGRTGLVVQESHCCTTHYPQLSLYT